MDGTFPVHFLTWFLCSSRSLVRPGTSDFWWFFSYVIRCQDPQLDGDEFVAGMLYWIESHYLERPSSAVAFFPSGKPQWCGIVPMASREGAFAIRDVEQWDDDHVVEVRESSSPILKDERDPLRYWTHLEEWNWNRWLPPLPQFSEGIWTDTHLTALPQVQWFSAIFVDMSSLALEQHDMAWITFVSEQQGETTGWESWHHSKCCNLKLVHFGWTDIFRLLESEDFWQET